MKDRVSTMTAAEKIGQRFALGFAGKTLSPEFRRLVKEYKAGNVILFRDDTLGFAPWLARRFGGEGALISLDPGEEEIARIRSQAVGHSSIVLGCYNAHLNRGQIELAKALARLSLIAVALRNPYDLKLLPPQVYKLAAWEYTENSFEAVAAVLRGDCRPAAPAAFGLI